ncbi:hypothetical protein AA313_de0204598 [Arthrobotrys entomopaga]|nr:hypothetical protein AA313_de0204598 [Arthrobotrys entomopaga]
MVAYIAGILNNTPYNLTYTNTERKHTLSIPPKLNLNTTTTTTTTSTTLPGSAIPCVQIPKLEAIPWYKTPQSPKITISINGTPVFDLQDDNYAFKITDRRSNISAKYDAAGIAGYLNTGFLYGMRVDMAWWGPGEEDYRPAVSFFDIKADIKLNPLVCNGTNLGEELVGYAPRMGVVILSETF